MSHFSSCTFLAFVLLGCGGSSDFLVFGDPESEATADVDVGSDAGDELGSDVSDAGDELDAVDVLEHDTRDTLEPKDTFEPKDSADVLEPDTRDAVTIDTSPACGAKGAACVSAVDCCTMYCAGSPGVCGCAAKGAVCTVSKQCCSGSCTPPFCD